MDPSRNMALHNAKLRTILQDFHNTSRDNNPNSSPPPAYDMVCGANSPNRRRPESPYDLDEMEDPFRAEREREEAAVEEEESDEIPEINIQASTQIRGHGNIISITQMDSIRIANLVAGLLHGYPLPTMPPAQQTQQAQQQQGPSNQGPAPPSPQSPQSVAQPPRVAPQPPTVDPKNRTFPPKVNITINCGAVVIGDRNIVGPGLGDIARHLQIANQRNQALAAQHSQQNQTDASKGPAATKPPGACAPGSSCGPVPYGPVPCAPHVGVGYGQSQPSRMANFTPPMSRSSSFGTEEGRVLKRKAEDGIEGRCSKKSC